MADIERKSALIARVQSLRASAAEELQFVADEIEPYANFDEAMTAEQIQDEVDGVEVTKESLAAIKGQVDAIIVEMEAARDDADAAISEAEDLQSDVDNAIEECTRLMSAGLAQIGAKSSRAPSTAAARLAAMADLLPDLIADAADPALDAETKAEVRAALAAQSAALDRMAREAIAAGHDALATEIVAARAGLPLAA